MGDHFQQMPTMKHQNLWHPVRHQTMIVCNMESDGSLAPPGHYARAVTIQGLQPGGARVGWGGDGGVRYLWNR